MKTALPLFAASLLLAGCMTTEEIAAVRAAEEAARAAPYQIWLGHAAEELVAVWGPPDREYETDGMRSLVYLSPSARTEVEVRFATTAPPQTGVRLVVSICRTTFVVAAGRIAAWDVSDHDCDPPPPPAAA
jgi:hypothetical protein